MKFRVLGVGMVLSVSVSIVGRAGAQTAPNAAEPAAAEPAPAPTPEAAPASAPADVKQLTPTTQPAPEPAPTPKGEQATAAAEQAEPAGQAYFGFGAQVGFYNPNGLTVHLGIPAIAIEATAGFAPLLLNYNSYSAAEDNKLKFLMPFEVSPQLAIHVVTFKHEMRGNLLVGYRYNRALGNGFTIGGELEGRVTRKLALQGLWGISLYPDAQDHLRGDQVPSDAEFRFPPAFGYGLSVGLLFYP